MVGTLRFAHPTKRRTANWFACSASSVPMRRCDKSTRRANHFWFSEIVSSPRIKNILL